jgi:Carboxypeptidase regulatory-like domain
MSKMPAVNSLFTIRALAVFFAAFAAFFPTNWVPAFAQTPLTQPRPAIIVSGTVRDSAGTPITDATVSFEEKGTSASIDAKTAADGTFSFLSLRAGTYVVRARKDGLREAASGPLELSLGQKKQLDLVLASAKPSAHTKKQSKVSSP